MKIDCRFFNITLHFIHRHGPNKRFPFSNIYMYNVNNLFNYAVAIHCTQVNIFKKERKKHYGNTVNANAFAYRQTITIL